MNFTGDVSRFGYPFIVQDLKTLLVSLPLSPPPTLLTDNGNLKEDRHEPSNYEDTEDDNDSFNYEPPDTFHENSDSDNESSYYSPSPSKKAKISTVIRDDFGNKVNNEKQAEGNLTIKKLEIKLTRLTTGQFTCTWPGCNDDDGGGGSGSSGQGKTFIFKEFWEDHMNRHTKTDEESKSVIIPQTYLCVWPDCNEGKGKEFNSKESWQVHMDRHMKTPKKKCDKCGLLFYSKDQLNFHVNREHGKIRRKRKSQGLPKEEAVSMSISKTETLSKESKATEDDDNSRVRRRRKAVKSAHYIFTSQDDSDDEDDERKRDDTDEDFQVSGDEEDNSDGDNDFKSSEKFEEEILNCTWPGCSIKKRFKTKLALEIHLDKHAGTPKRKCEKCGLHFYSYYEMSNHLKEVHKVAKKKKKAVPQVNYNLKTDKETGKYICSWTGCGKIYAIVDQMKVHIDRHNGTPRKQCGECDKWFYTRMQRNRHRLREHVGERNFGCEICGASFFMGQDLRNHKSAVHSETFKKWTICETCGKRIRSNHLKSHVRVVHDGVTIEGKFECHLCPVKLSGEMLLKLHLLKTHQVWKDEEEKREIERWVERRKELRRKWKCPVRKCRVGHLTEEGLKKHVEEKHGGNWGDAEGNVEGDRYRLRCEVCGKGFHHTGRYKEHMETHKAMEERNRPFKCDVCGKGFPRVGSLRAHLVVHEEKRKKWWCEICKKSFVEEKVLEKHLEGKSHRWRVEMMEEGGRSCEFCGKMFKNANCLSQHRRRMHRNDKTEPPAQ